MENFIKVFGMSVIPLIIMNWAIYFWAAKKSKKAITLWGNFESFEGKTLKVITSITTICVILAFVIVVYVAWNDYLLKMFPQA